MEKEDWMKIMRMVGWVYLPIALLIIGVFVYIQYRNAEIKKAQDNTEYHFPVPAVTTPVE